MNAPEKLIGSPVRRKEDYRFLTGNGQYTDDVVLPHQSYGYFLRSPHAHARIKSIDTSEAAASPGVIAVLTGDDMAADKVGGLPCGWLIHSIDGSPMKEPPHPRWRTARCATWATRWRWSSPNRCSRRDAAEKIVVDYEELPAVIGPPMPRRQLRSSTTMCPPTPATRGATATRQPPTRHSPRPLT
jgi:carbon-monoxide dehydrogenase large subunit